MHPTRPAPAQKPLAPALLALALGSGNTLSLAAESAPPEAAEPAVVTVTGTREKLLLSQAPASVAVIGGDAVRLTAPAHPQQLLGQVPGVAVAVTNGEGHTTAIRQPFTTGPMYLFLEDGIPTRATGFFNHNALYEVNLPAAASVEVVRGPNTALYGSDAIGGTVNVLTRAASADDRADAQLEAGSHGWRRLLAGGSWGGAVRADVNLTHSAGWREATGHDRAGASLRWDTEGAGGSWKTIVGATRIDQQTGASSPLPRALYEQRPTTNLMPIAFRDVGALRASTEYTREAGATLLTLTPYLRRNTMVLNGSFNLASDPRIEHTGVSSAGLLAKWRRDLGGAWRTRLVAGLDLDRSEGTRREDTLQPTRSGSGAATAYTAYTVGGRLYDYEVRTTGVSPYLHTEFSPTAALRVSAGLRHDRLAYRMHNRVDTAFTGTGSRLYAQQREAAVDHGHTSPKLGLSYALTSSASLYASLNHGFRAPSEAQLFRAGSAGTPQDARARAALALQLRPIKADQLELGARGQAGGWSWDVVAYELVKRDDLVNQRDPATNVSTSVNAGKTRHRGLEAGLHGRLGRHWQVDAAWSWAVHRYIDWRTAGADYSGKEMESAPRRMGNTRLTWKPADGTRVQLEWVHLGAYWLEASNAAAFGRYGGHDLLHLRARHALGPRLALVGRIQNLTDRRHADSAGVSSNTPVFAPGQPRTFHAGLEASW